MPSEISKTMSNTMKKLVISLCALSAASVQAGVTWRKVNPFVIVIR